MLWFRLMRTRQKFASIDLSVVNHFPTGRYPQNCDQDERYRAALVTSGAAFSPTDDRRI